MTTITISVNGEKIIITSPCSLNQALDAWSNMATNSSSTIGTEMSANNPEQSRMKSYVIALNQTFIPRNQYGITHLNNGDDIELLSPMAGG
ncbi:MAG: thiamine biosynthesis protein ThiS [Oleispira sp.]|jgi:thiamine biosynthesis protein ThiS